MKYNSIPLSDRLINPSLGINLNTVFETYIESIPESQRCPERWHNFLFDMGLRHKSLHRIDVVNQKKWAVAKIKYGI